MCVANRELGDVMNICYTRCVMLKTREFYPRVTSTNYSYILYPKYPNLRHHFFS